MQGTLFGLNSSVFSKMHIFKNGTDLGRIYQTIDREKLVALLRETRNPAGAPSWLNRHGYFGMMFLKHYTGFSDEKLLDRLNTERSAAQRWVMQMFCGTLLSDNKAIRDNSFFPG